MYSDFTRSQTLRSPSASPLLRVAAAPSCLRTEWLTNGQDYPGIISYSLCKHSSIIPAELSHSPFAVEWFIRWLHVTRKYCCCCCTELESVHLLLGGGFPCWLGWSGCPPAKCPPIILPKIIGYRLKENMTAWHHLECTFSRSLLCTPLFLSSFFFNVIRMMQQAGHVASERLW